MEAGVEGVVQASSVVPGAGTVCCLDEGGAPGEDGRGALVSRRIVGVA
jgi:hypothetical protein